MKHPLACLSLLFLAWSANAATVAPASGTDAPAAPRKVLRYAIEVAETGFDPAEISDLYSRNFCSNIFDAPLRFAYLAAPGTMEPSTADGMPEMSADYKTFTFHIKKGIYFADDPAFNGKKRELTAEDYVYSYKRFYDPHWNSPSYDTWETVGVLGMNALREEAIKTKHFDYDRPVEGLKTLDRYTFQIKISVPSPRFLQNFTDASLMGAVAREVVEKYGEDIMAHPVGTGPYRLVEWHRSSKSIFERNPNYRVDIFHVTPDPNDPDAQRIAAKLDGKRLPFIDRIEVSDMEESQPRWLSFLNGEYDFLHTMPRDMADLALPNNKPAPTLVKKDITIERRPQIDVNLLLFNMDNPVIGGYTAEKVALRRAISLGFDEPEMIRTYLKMQAIPAQTITMPGLYSYDPDLRTENGVTDVARANALLDEYHYLRKPGEQWRSNPDGSPLVVLISTQPDQRSRIMDEVMKKSFNRIGVQSDFRPAKWPDNLKAARAGNYMLWWLGFSAAGPDPSSGMINGYGPATGNENLSRFKFAEFDKLYLQQDAMPDGPERLEVLKRMNMILTAYAPMKFTAHRYVIDMSYPWVLNYRRWAFSQGDFWHYVDIDPVLEQKIAHR